METTLRVLLVEDSRETAEQLKELFHLMFDHVEVSVAATEKAALAKMEKGAPDLVLLDLNLKRGSGLPMIQRLKANIAPPTVVVLTNFALPMYRDLALLKGADYFLDKAHDLDALPTIVESIVDWRDRMRREMPYPDAVTRVGKQADTQSLH